MGRNSVAKIGVLDKGRNDVSHIFAPYATASNKGVNLEQSNSWQDDDFGSISTSWRSFASEPIVAWS